MIRVVVKASTPAAKAALERLLKPSPILALVPDASEGGTSDAEEPPDVVLLEALALDSSTVRQVLEWGAGGTSVVLMVRAAPPEMVTQALRAGAKAVLPGRSTAPEIVAAIQAAGSGLVVLDSTGAHAVLGVLPAAANSAPIPMAEALTPRELEVLRLLAAGLGNKQIAARLGMSEHTAKFHVASIMGKLGANSRTEAVTLGIRQGLILL